MKPIKTALLALPLLAAGCNRDSGTAKIRPLEAGSVRVEDAFWGPRYEKWEHVTVGDPLLGFATRAAQAGGLQELVELDEFPFDGKADGHGLRLRYVTA